MNCKSAVLSYIDLVDLIFVTLVTAETLINGG